MMNLGLSQRLAPWSLRFLEGFKHSLSRKYNLYSCNLLFFKNIPRHKRNDRLVPSYNDSRVLLEKNCSSCAMALGNVPPIPAKADKLNKHLHDEDNSSFDELMSDLSELSVEQKKKLKVLHLELEVLRTEGQKVPAKVIICYNNVKFTNIEKVF